jgi:competence protein ComEC
MSGVVFYTLLLSFTSGIFLRSFFVLDWTVASLLCLVGTTLLLWWYRKRTLPQSAAVCIFAVCIIGIAFGIGRYDLAVYQAPSPLLLSDVGTVHTYTGQIVQEPESATNGTSVVVQVGRERLLVKIDRQSMAQYGDTVTVIGTPAIPEPFMTDLGREFDYSGYLRAKGISYTMSFARLTVTDTTTGNSILRFLFRMKAQFIRSLTEMLPEPYVGLGEGLLLGVNHVLGNELETVFRRAGIIHIVVLSGYNILLVVQFVLLILARVLPMRARAMVGVLAIVCFALIVGLGASVIRASIMAALSLVAVLFGRKYAVTRALFLAGAVMLLVNPYLLTNDIGFQLSFMATFGLLFVAPHLTKLVAWIPEWFGVREFLLATLSTQIAVLPILLYNMGQFSVISLVVNVLVLPVVSLAMLLTFLTGLIALFSHNLALPISYAAYLVLAYIINIATKFAALPFAVVHVPFFPGYAVFVSYAVFGMWLYLRTRRRTTVTPAAIDLTPIAAWTVVEETDESLHTKTGQASNAYPVSVKAAPVATSDTPIFFR